MDAVAHKFNNFENDTRAVSYFAGRTSIASASVCLMTTSSPFLTSPNLLTSLLTFSVAVFAAARAGSPCGSCS